MTIDEMINKLETLSIEKYKKADMLDEVVSKKQIVDMCDIDLIEATLCRQKSDDYEQFAEWLKELKAYREAWDGMKEGLLEMSRLHEYVSIKHMIQLIDKVRPEEGDAE